MEIVKGKGKEKETEIVNLEDIIDVKGWKALGNRLSQHKVTKVSLTEEQEDTGLEEGDDDNDLIDEKATASGKGSESSKKKEPESQPAVIEEDGQAALFAPPEKPKGQVQKAAAPKPKVKAEQAALFGEEKPKQKAEVKPPNPNGNKPKKDKGADDKAFGVGETIELEL
jgi:topoisomerase-4 subunit A